MTSSIKSQYANKNTSAATLDFHLSGNNNQVPGSPDIDAKGNMVIGVAELGDNGSIATFSGEVRGDKFPANETYIMDQQGNGVFLGVSGADGNPYTSLPGDGNALMSKFSIGVRFDKDGNIQYINNNGKNYSVEQWNTQFSQLDPKSGDVSTKK